MAINRRTSLPGTPFVATTVTHPVMDSHRSRRGASLLHRTLRGSRWFCAVALWLVALNVSAADPTLTLPGANPSSINDEQTSRPFDGATLSGSGPISVAIRFPKANGTISAVTGLTSAIDGNDIVYTLSLATQSVLRSLVFTPVADRIPITASGETTTFEVQATDANGSVSASVSLTVTPLNDVPTISFSGSLSKIYDNQTSTPFASGDVNDPDAGDVITATILYTASHGVLTPGAGSPALSLNGTAGNYSVSGDVANLETFLKKLVYNPTDNRLPVAPSGETTETTTFTVTVRDLALTGNSATRAQSVESYNDAPRILGSLTSSIPDNVLGATVFAALSIQDPDKVKVGGVLVPQPVSLLVDFGEGPGVSNAGGLADGTVRYETTGTAAPPPGDNQVTAALQALRYNPVANLVPVGQSTTVPVTVQAVDSLGSATSNNLTFGILSINDAPILGVSLSPVTVPDTGAIQPFSVTVADPDVGETFRIQIIAVNDPNPDWGVFEPAGFDSYTGTGAQVQDFMDGVVYRPTVNLSANRDVTLRVQLTDLHPAPANPAEGSPVQSPLLTLTILGKNDLPQIAVPANPIFRTTDDSGRSILPFRGVGISDPDGQTLTVRLAIEGLTPGTFRLVTDGGSELNGATIEFQGTPEVVSRLIKTVTFQASPRPDRVVGDTDTVRLSINVSDEAGGLRTDRSTTVIITAVNAAPTISGLPPVENQPLRLDPATPGDPIRPFSTPSAGSQVSIADDDGARVAVTLRIDNPAKGHLANEAHPISGYTASGQGTVVVASTGHGLTTGTMVRITGYGGALDYNGTHEITRVDADHFSIPVTYVDNASPKGTWDRGVVEDPSKPGTYTYSGLPDAATAALRELQFVVNPDFLFPPSTPGLTTLTLNVEDSVFNQATAELTILIAEEPVNWMVTSDEDDGSEGTLRWVIGQIVASKSASASVTFALPAYPAIIRLVQGPITLERNVILKGPGADLLALSGDRDGDGSPDVPLFQVQADVRMEGLTLTHGAALGGLTLTGGAAYVGPTGTLTLDACAIQNSVALQWGGGIDVDGGRLIMRACLVRGNRTDLALGLGGGGVSLFTDQPCRFENTTFSGNVQGAATGIGGGALYVENVTPATVLDILITHCTFAENGDETTVGATALYANVFGSGVRVRNSIFADGQTRNLDVAGAASIISLGGNLSDDRTRTVLTQDGQPKEVFLLDHPTDLTNVSGLLTLPIDETLRPLPAYQLPRRSRAVGYAISPALPTDQRGVWRDGDPDSGALERGAGPRIVLNEIGFGPPSARPDFLEFYVPRDARAVQLGGVIIRVNGDPVFTFPPNTRVVAGQGLIVADTSLVPVTCPPPVPADCPPPTPVLTLPAGQSLGLEKRSLVELLRPNGEVVLSVAYVGQFVDPAAPSDTTQFDGTSITLAPQLRGSAYLPHGIVGPGPLDGAIFDDPATPADSPGGTITTPFGSTNGFPFAVADAFIVDEDVAVDLPVRVNDLEEDGQDRVVIVDVSPAASPLTENDASSLSALGATVTIVPASAPLRGASILYDPQTSAALKALPVGYEAVDRFHYTIVDIGSGEIESIASSDGGASATVQVTGHRLSNGDEVHIANSSTTSYNGTFAVTVLDDDHFKIPTPFVDNPAEPGVWETADPRSPTARSQAEVVVTVLGANDPPVAQPDFVGYDQVNEDAPVRIMAGPSLVGIAAHFDTDDDYPVRPEISTVSLLGGNPIPGPDTDPDRDETVSLRVVGVVGSVKSITGYAAAPDSGNAVVESPDHGLGDGDVVLISGYGGFAGYNGFQAVTVRDSDHFEIPVLYVDDASAKGIWAILTDANRLQASTALGASVRLEIRVDPLETSVVYDPTVSAELNTLALGTTRRDSFYYAVSDSHGAVSLGDVTLEVDGRNDAPVTVSDPASLGRLDSLGDGITSLPDLIASLGIAYYIPPASGLSGRADVELVTDDAPPERVLLSDVFRTDQATRLTLLSGDLTGNDLDVDSGDPGRLQIDAGSVDSTSRAGAAVSVDASGNILYDPRVSTQVLQKLAREEALLDTFTIGVTDGHSVVSSLVAVLVVGVNDTPQARNDVAGTDEDNPVTIDPLANDSDVDQNGAAPDNLLRLVPAVQTTALGATVTVAPDSFTYDPTPSAYLDGLAQGQSAQEIIRTTTMDGSFLFANDDAFQVAADGSDFALNVVANDQNLTGVGRPVSDYYGVPGQAPVTVVAPAHGLVSGMAVHISGYGGVGLYNRAYVVDVVDANTFTIPVRFEDNAAAKGLWTRFRITSVTTPSRGGSVAIAAGAGSLVYTPAVNFVGDEVLAYTLMDDLGNSDGAVVRVRTVVNQLNGNLQANADHFSAARGQSPVLDVLANDNILPVLGQNLTLTRIVSQPVLLPAGTESRDHVALVGNAIRFTQSWSGPTTGFPYEVAFAYEVSGGGTAKAIAQVVVRVLDRGGQLPTRGDAFAVLSGSVDNALTVLDNDRVLPGTTETLRVAQIVSPPAKGTARLNSDSTAILYTPAAGFVGEETFAYRATDNLGGTGDATVTVAVGRLSTSSDFFAVPFNDPMRTDDNDPVDLDVLANDPILGSAGVELTLTAVEAADSALPALGTIEVGGGGTHLVFTANEGVEGEREFIYTVADQSNPPHRATGRLVLIVARPSVRASSDFFGVEANSSLNRLPVLQNDAAIPDQGRTLTLISVGAGLDAPDRGGTVTLNATRDGLLYTPARGFVGEETFTYTMTDSRNTDTAKVVVSVGSGWLTASADAFVVFFDVAGGREFTLPVLANDRVWPSDGQALVITGVGINDINGQNAPSEYGQVSVTPDGSALIYVANPDVAPGYTERFTYEISDGTERRAQAEVLVRVEDRTAARELETNADAYTVEQDSTGNRLAVLANDGVKPADAAGWTITGVSSPVHGGLARVSGGNILFSPAPGFVGTDTFTYDVSDGVGGTASAAVTVKVGDVQLSPDRFAALSASSGNVFDVLANDAIRPTTSAGYHLAGVVSPGSLGGTVEVRDGVVLYSPVTPAPAPGVPTFPYVETFEYVVEDDSGGAVVGRAEVEVHEAESDRDSSEVQVTIRGVNDRPTLTLPDPAEFRITDKQTVAPFAGVVIGDIDNQGQEILEVRVVLSDPAAGRLRSLDTGALIPETVYGNGVWVFTGTGAEVTGAIQNLKFVPTENYVPVPQTWPFVFDLVVTDPFVTVPVAGAVTVLVQAVDDPPTLLGTVSGQPVYYLGAIRPFASVLISDVDDRTLQPLRVTVSFDTTHGTFLESGGFIPLAPGVFAFAGTAAEATAAIRKIVFAPNTHDRLKPDLTAPPEGEVTVFTVAVDDGYANPVLTDSHTSVIAYHSLVTKVVAPDGAKPDQFGYAVAATRTLVAIGAPYRDAAFNDQGGVYLRSRDAGGASLWGQVAQLDATDPAGGMRFGHAVALSGERLAAGAPLAKVSNKSYGAAYVFEPTAAGGVDWQANGAKLLAADRAENDQFGATVSLDGDFLAVGAPLDDDRGDASGSVYIFRRVGFKTWNQVAKIVPADGAKGAQFGYAVALSGETLAVGAPFDDDNGKDSGSAYLFRRNATGTSWTQVGKVLPTLPNESSDGHPDDRFGFSVALDAETLGVGAPRENGGHYKRGSVYVFAQNRGGADHWGQVAKLGPSDAMDYDEFGRAVTVSKDLIVVGMPLDGKHPDYVKRSGSAWVYRRDQGGADAWGFVEKLDPPDNQKNDEFGRAVALACGTLVAGARKDDDVAKDSGAAYIYELRYGKTPRAATPIPNQLAVVGELFSLLIPAEAFGDADVVDSLRLTVAGAGGGPLPSWLGFDAVGLVLSGTPTAAQLGTTTLRVTATDLCGDSASAPLVIEVVNQRPPAPLVPGAPLTYEEWVARLLPQRIRGNSALEATVWGRLANPDLDEFANYEEYAFGSRLFAVSPVDGPGLVIGVAQDGRIAVSFRRRTNDPSLEFGLEFSPDLEVWTDAATLDKEEFRTPIGYDAEWVTCLLPANQVSPQLFFRVRITSL